MSAHRIRVSPLAAALAVFALTLPAAGFSQIGTQEGAGRQREGIVSVPLPPLPGGVQEASPATGDAAGGVQGPATAEDQKPATAPAQPAVSQAPAPAGAAPADGGEPRSQEADPSRATPAQETDPNSTDEGEPPTEGSEAPGAATSEPPAAKAGAAGDGTATAPVAPDGKVAAGEEGSTPPAEILYGDADLPTPVRDLRTKLMEVARTGDIELLRPFIEVGEDGTVLTFGGQDGDPIDYLKSASGDGEGVEILAILLELLQAGHVRSEPGSDNEAFVWPYFTGVAVDKLTKPQKVELFELVTAGDYQEMVGFGAYNFYRTGISPDGKLRFFVAGD